MEYKVEHKKWDRRFSFTHQILKGLGSGHIDKMSDWGLLIPLLLNLNFSFFVLDK